MIAKLKGILFRECKPWRDWRIKCDWRKEIAPYYDKNFKLTEYQRTGIHELWNKYAKVDDYYHAFYTQKTGKFYAEYLPDDIYYTKIDRFYNNPDLALWLDDKSLYENLLHDPCNEVRFPCTLAIQSGGYWVNTDFQPITYSQIVRAVKDAGKVFVKKSFDSCGGKGVCCFNADKADKSSFDNLISQMGGGNLVIQKSLEQSSVLADLNPSSVNTIRLISLLKSDGTVKIYSVVLRMGINGSVVDNASSGGITVGVRDDGRLKCRAFTSRGIKYERCHPDTKVEFESVVIPGFDRIKAAVKRLHYRLPRLRLLSWDIALDKDNAPVLIEVNMKMGELDFHQLNNGPLFGEDTREILDEVYGKRH